MMLPVPCGCGRKSVGDSDQREGKHWVTLETSINNRNNSVPVDFGALIIDTKTLVL